ALELLDRSRVLGRAPIEVPVFAAPPDALTQTAVADGVAHLHHLSGRRVLVVHGVSSVVVSPCAVRMTASVRPVAVARSRVSQSMTARASVSVRGFTAAPPSRCGRCG